jgi:DNA-binding transcriptional LysR family regulator
MDRLMSMRVFQRVVDEGGFAAAARALDMSPAVVTRLVADLEEHLGTRLLHRTTRRLSLSEAGEAYLSRVRAILQDIDDAHVVASAHTQELAGVLRVLVPPVLAAYLLAPLLAGFAQRFPKIVLDITVELYKEPPIEDFDITLFAADAGFNGDVIARKIITSEVILVASPAYLKRKGTPEQPEDLVQHDGLRFKTPGPRPRLWRLVHSQQPQETREVEVNTVMWSNHSDTLLRAAIDGIGLTFSSVDVVAPHLASGQLVQVLQPWTYGQVTLYAALPSRQFLPQRTRVFLDFLTEQTRLLVATALTNATQH